jgi:hypothetical protein
MPTNVKMSVDFSASCVVIIYLEGTRIQLFVILNLRVGYLQLDADMWGSWYRKLVR